MKMTLRTYPDIIAFLIEHINRVGFYCAANALTKEQCRAVADNSLKAMSTATAAVRIIGGPPLGLPELMGEIKRAASTNPELVAQYAEGVIDYLRQVDTHTGWVPVNVPVPPSLVTDHGTPCGTKLLLLALPGSAAPVRGIFYGGLLNEFHLDGSDEAQHPTHWMPMPSMPPPTTAQKAGHRVEIQSARASDDKQWLELTLKG